MLQSESVTLSVDYLISSTQAGRATCLGFFLPSSKTNPLSPNSLYEPYLPIAAFTI